MDSAVDRRNADETPAMLQLDPSDNLPWRPVVLQDADLDVGVQGCILKALMRMTGFPALLVECLCSQRAVRHRLDCWSRIAAKLTRDGRLAPVQQMGNLRDGFALSKKKEYLFSLKWCKMCVVAHRISFCYRWFSSNTIIAKKSMCRFNLVV